MTLATALKTTTVFTPSPYQQRIFDWIKTERGSAIVKAVAGSGKTTTIINALEFIPENACVQLFAFNTSIARKLNEDIEKLRKRTCRSFSKVRASTFHSVGFGAVAKFLGKAPREIQTDGAKLRRLFEKISGDKDDVDLYSDYVCRLVSLAKGQGLGAISPDTEDAWNALVQHHDLYLDSLDADDATALAHARRLLVESNRVAKEEAWIDFDDQLYLPLLWRLRLWQNDWVFVDEAQDTNPVRRAIAKLALRPGGRAVFVGDPRQAIYGFTGASHDALDIVKREFNAVELPLTVSYRCPRAVVEAARTFVPYLEAFEGAQEGQVSWMDLRRREGDKSNEPTVLETLDAHDAILCRNVAPLVKTAYALISSGTGCNIVGKEIGAGLTALIRKMRAKGVDNLVEKLHAFREREVAKFTAKGEEGKAESVADRVAAIESVVDALPENARNLANLVKTLEGMFSDTNGTLTLSTVHKAKGREWRRVAILRPDLMPSKWARQDWQQLQEENGQYVAYTRAMEHLIFINPERKEGGS